MANKGELNRPDGHEWGTYVLGLQRSSQQLLTNQYKLSNPDLKCIVVAAAQLQIKPDWSNVLKKAYQSQHLAFLVLCKTTLFNESFLYLTQQDVIRDLAHFPSRCLHCGVLSPNWHMHILISLYSCPQGSIIQEDSPRRTTKQHNIMLTFFNNKTTTTTTTVTINLIK